MAVISPTIELFSNDDINHVHANFKLKKATRIKPSIQIKFGLHHCFSYDKIFKIKLHLSMFAQYFRNIVFTLNN